MSGEGGKPVVVMVDDEGDFLDAIKLWVEPGYTFVGLTGGDGLLEKLAALKPDLLVLDVVMPGEDGFELCRKVRADARFADLPVLFLTGSRAAENFLRNFETGGTGYATKPVGRRRLLALMNELVGAPADEADTPAID